MLFIQMMLTVLRAQTHLTLLRLNTKIRDKEGIPANEPTLIFVRKKADDDVLNYFDYYYIDWNSDLTPAPPKSPDTMEIFIRTLMTTKFSLEVQRSDTIRHVKRKIREKQGVLPYMQRLFFAGMLLESDCTFADYNINVDEEFILHLEKSSLWMSVATTLSGK